MSLFNKKSPWDKDWRDLEKKEEKFIARRMEGPTFALISKLDRFVPKKLSATLDAAFAKGFALIFEKGTGIIEKTYNKEKKKANFKINTYASEVRGDRQSIRKFTKQAKSAKATNLAVSSIDGLGLGLIGAGIPDIPLFSAMVLKSVYEIALSYGYDYQTDEEKAFILKVIEVSMYDEEEFAAANRDLNELIDQIVEDGDTLDGYVVDKEAQIKMTARALSREMLYTKFLQGQLIIGIAGGIFDPVYVNRISTYAVLKYRRRFLRNKVSSRPSSL